MPGSPTLLSVSLILWPFLAFLLPMLLTSFPLVMISYSSQKNQWKLNLKLLKPGEVILTKRRVSKEKDQVMTPTPLRSVWIIGILSHLHQCFGGWDIHIFWVDYPWAKSLQDFFVIISNFLGLISAFMFMTVLTLFESWTPQKIKVLKKYPHPFVFQRIGWL